MAFGHYYVSKRDYLGAINRFKVVLTQYPASLYVEEALARLAESCLSLLSDVPPGTKLNREYLASEAQTVVAVLDRKFPDSDLSIEVHAALRSAGLEPVEDEKSSISRASNKCGRICQPLGGRFSRGEAASQRARRSPQRGEG